MSILNIGGVYIRPQKIELIIFYILSFKLDGQKTSPGVRGQVNYRPKR